MRKLREYVTAFKVGFFLAQREIRRANLWSTLLIISIMALTFLNLIVVRGLLVGLIAGVQKDIRQHYIGDIFLSKLEENRYIENAPFVLSVLDQIPQIMATSARYQTGGRIEANYQTRVNLTDEPNTAGGLVFGIDPVAESVVNQIDDFLIAGSYLQPGDYDQIMIGSDLLRAYSIDGEGLDNIEPGVKVRLSLNNLVREVTVKGILDSKVEQISSGIYLVDDQLRQMLGRSDYGVDEISVRLYQRSDDLLVKNILLANGIDQYSQVETYDEGEPAFVQDITNTFAILANIISGISLVVASITTFIIIFVNAVTQRQLIGIMKGIGIHWFAIVSSYMMQAWFYALIGTLAATVIIYGGLEPYVAQNPIDFPFSDGILLVPLSGTAYRACLLFVATLISGYIPAKMIVNKNTLDSILGR